MGTVGRNLCIGGTHSVHILVRPVRVTLRRLTDAAADWLIGQAQTNRYEFLGQEIDPITVVALKVLAALAVVEAAAQIWIWLGRI